MGINSSSQMSLFINGRQIETVRTFSFLGGIMDENGGTDSDVLSRINKSRAAGGTYNRNIIFVNT